MGEALNDLTPAGPLLGEPAKVVAVSDLMAKEEGASSVILENLIYALGAVLFMSSGIVLAAVAVAALRGFWWVGGGLVIGLLVCLAMVFWIANRRISFIGSILDLMRRRGWRLALWSAMRDPCARSSRRSAISF